MAKTKSSLRRVLRDLTRDPKRSPLFHWLYERHDVLAGPTEGRRLAWEPLRERVTTLGLTDHQGNLPSDRTLRDTWRKVREVKAREQAVAARAQSAKLQPSRMPADWRPTPVPVPPPPVRPREAAPAFSNHPTAGSDEDVPEHVKAAFELLDRQFAWRDRHILPPKRKG